MPIQEAQEGGQGGGRRAGTEEGTSKRPTTPILNPQQRPNAQQNPQPQQTGNKPNTQKQKTARGASGSGQTSEIFAHLPQFKVGCELAHLKNIYGLFWQI